MALATFMYATMLLLCSLKLMPRCHLNLSPLVKRGDIHKAQRQSQHWIQGVESYSGYFTVDERYDSNMFFWFFPAEDKSEAPVLLWLNGGPGRPSTFGALLENGPLALNEQLKLERRRVPWTRSFSMLYVDNPVGIGYSYTVDERGYSKNNEDISKNLYSVLVQFFKMFPAHVQNSFYVGGQSYACKFASPLAMYIHDRNHDNQHPPEVFIKLHGMYMGGGFCDPDNMVPVFYDFASSFGFVSDEERDWYRNMRPWSFKSSSNPYPDAVIELELYDNLLGGEATNTRMYEKLKAYLALNETRILLRAGFAKNDPMDQQLNDALRSLDPTFLHNVSSDNAFLMDNYKVLHYSGNLDVVVSVPMVEAFLMHVPWSGQRLYRDSSRRPWRLDDGELAGWFTSVGNFNRVVVRNAGHNTPYDQPERTLAMMERFVAGDFVM